MPRPRASFLVLFLLALPGVALAQDAQQQHPAFTAREAALDDLLEQASQQERAGAYEQAVATYLEVEEELRKLRAKFPGAQPTTEVGPGIDRGVDLYLRDRIAALPADAQRRYRLSIDPRANEALAPALRLRDPEAIEAVLARYPLSGAVDKGLPILAALAMERGELSRAVRVYRLLQERAETPGEVRKAALLRCYAATMRGMGGEARAALKAFVESGGDPDRARAFGPRQVTVRELVEAIQPPPAKLELAAGFDPGRLERSQPLAKPELTEELIRGLDAPPGFQHGVFAADRRVLYVADHKTVRAIPVDARRAVRGWTYSQQGDDTEPSRVEAALLRPAVGGGVVYATLHRNRPAQVEVKIDDEGEEEHVVHRRKDWRVVALDRRTGRLVWDSGNRESFESIARDAEWVSAPLLLESALYAVVLRRENANLRVSLVRLNGANGDVEFQTFIASRSAYDHLGLGAPPAPPVGLSNGRVLVSTGLGVVAAVEPTQGGIEWISRYPVVPQGSEATLVLANRRFRPCEPLGGSGPVVVAPVDGTDVAAFDPEDGRTLWTAPRGDARLCVPGPQGQVLLLGRRLVALDRASGKILVQGPDLGDEITAQPAVFRDELVASTPTQLLRVGLADGALRARFRYESPRDEAGCAMAVADGKLVTVGYGRLNVYQSLDVAVADLRARHAGKGELNVLLGKVHAQRGDVYESIKLLQKAVRSGIGMTARLEAQRTAVRLLDREALKRRRAGDAKGFLARAERVDYFLGALGVRPEKRPRRRGEFDLLGQAAPVLRSWADDLAEGDDPQGWAKAARAYQRLTWAPPGTLVTLDGGTQVDVAAYASARVRKLVAKRGPEPYAEFDAFAKTAFEQARKTSNKTALEELVVRYPASSVSGDVRWELAAVNRAAGLKADAGRELERFLAEHPQDARCAHARARLVVLYTELGRLAMAREQLQTLCDMDPEPVIQLTGDAAAQPARAWAVPHRKALFGGISPAALRHDANTAGLEAPLARVYRSVTELSQGGAELVKIEGQTDQRGLIYLRRGDTLEVRRVPDAERVLLITGLPAATARLQPLVAGDVVVVPFEDRVDAWSLSRGSLAWRVTISSPPTPMNVGPRPVHALYAADGAVLVLTGNNNLVAIDATEGTRLWRHELPFRATGGVLGQGTRAYAWASSPAKLICYDLASGEEKWTYAPQGPQGVRVRVSNPHWLDSGTLMMVEDGQKVVSLDARAGKPNWRSASDGAWVLELLTSSDGGFVATRTHGADGAGLRVYDAGTGKELWRDTGRGAERAAAPARPAGARSSLNRLAMGDGVLYSFRTSAGRSELWAQEAKFGKRLWLYRLPAGSRATAAIETPSAVLVARTGALGRRSTVSVLSRGDGKLLESHGVSGRRLMGAGAVAADGVLAVSTDRGLSFFAPLDTERLQQETVVLAEQLRRDPLNAGLRARLAQRLEQLGRRGAALDVLEEGILAEGLRLGQFDRMFSSMTAMAETESEEDPLEMGIRRLPRPPEIDGELSDWWRPWSGVELKKPRFVQPIQQEPGLPLGRWTGEEDLSARLYMGWDSKYFYFAIDVADTNLRPYDSESTNWIGDCLLIAIDCMNNGGEGVLGDDVLLSLALTLPKKKDNEEEEEEEQQDDEEKKPSGRYFVRKKDDNSGAIYEAAIPWDVFVKNGRVIDPTTGPKEGMTFGFNIVLTDDDGDRFEGQGDGERTGARGALKTLELTPSVLLHQEKSRLWQGYIPRRFAKITLR